MAAEAGGYGGNTVVVVMVMAAMAAVVMATVAYGYGGYTAVDMDGDGAVMAWVGAWLTRLGITRTMVIRYGYDPVLLRAYIRRLRPG